MKRILLILLIFQAARSFALVNRIVDIAPFTKIESEVKVVESHGPRLGGGTLFCWAKVRGEFFDSEALGSVSTEKGWAVIADTSKKSDPVEIEFESLFAGEVDTCDGTFTMNILVMNGFVPKWTKYQLKVLGGAGTLEKVD